MIPDTEKWKQFVAKNNEGCAQPTKKTRKPKALNTEKESAPKGHPEEDLTMECRAEFIKKYPEYHKCLHHTPNENFVSEIGGKRKAMGVVAGVADFQLNIPAIIDGVTIAGLDIELKVGRNGQRWSQKEYEDYSLATWHIYRVIKSVEDFMECIDNYMSHVDPSVHAAIKRLHKMWEAKWKDIDADKEKRQEKNERAEIAKRLGIDPSRIHGLD